MVAVYGDEGQHETGEVLDSQKSKRDLGSFYDRYLGDIRLVEPDVAQDDKKLQEKIVETIKKEFVPNKDGRGLSYVCEKFAVDIKSLVAGVAENIPEVLPVVADVAYRGLSIPVETENEPFRFRQVHGIMLDIFKHRPDNPELSEMVFKLSEHGFYMGDSFKVYNGISEMVSANSDLASEGVKYVQLGVDKYEERQDSQGLRSACSALSWIVRSAPKLAKDVLRTTQLILENDNHDSASLRAVFSLLPEIAKADRQLAPKITKVFQNGMRHKKNDQRSLLHGYKVASLMYGEELCRGHEIMDVLKVGLEHKMNNVSSLNYAACTTSEILSDFPALARELKEMEGLDKFGKARRAGILKDLSPTSDQSNAGNVSQQVQPVFEKASNKTTDMVVNQSYLALQKSSMRP